jgi:hypothetical protein
VVAAAAIVRTKFLPFSAASFACFFRSVYFFFDHKICRTLLLLFVKQAIRGTNNASRQTRVGEASGFR